MRRALLGRLPSFSAFYGLHPWDVERLSFAEVGEYVRQLDEHVKRGERV